MSSLLGKWFDEKKGYYLVLNCEQLFFTKPDLYWIIGRWIMVPPSNQYLIR